MPQAPTRQITLAMAFAMAAAVLWAILEEIGGALLRGYHPLQVVWVRYVFHLAALFLIFGPQLGMELARTTRPALQVTRGLLMLIMPLCFLAGVAVSPPADVLGAFWSAPLLAMLLATWMLRERAGIRGWGIALAGWVGALLLIRPGERILRPEMAPALGMALCFSLYVVMTRQLRDEATATNLFFTAVCVLVPLSVALPRFWRTPSPVALAVMAAIGLLGLGVLYALDRATDLAPISVVAPVLWTQPVWAFAFAALFGDVRPGRGTFVGAALITVALLMLIAFSGHRIMGRHHASTPLSAASGRDGLVPGAAPGTGSHGT